MDQHIFKKKIWTGISPWIVIGAALVLFPIFAVLTVQGIHRQRDNGVRLLLEKGAALIRSFEAGTRTGMARMGWGGGHLMRLIMETANQPDIDYILVSDINGVILAHNNPVYIGRLHGEDLNLKEVSGSQEIRWREITHPVDDHSGKHSKKTFEVYSLFTPSSEPASPLYCRAMINEWQKTHKNVKLINPDGPLIIFIGLEMTSVEEAIGADIRHSIIMAIILLLIGFSGIIILFLTQNYRLARASYFRIKAFSENLVENMPIGLFAVDPDNKIASVNQNAIRLFGLNTNGLLGMDSKNVLPVEIQAFINETSHVKSGIEKEIVCNIGGIGPITLEVGASEIHDDTGIYMGRVILMRDMTELKSLRDEIARSQRLASIGSLAAGVAHEIRNPLSSIKGFAVYFKERYREIKEDGEIADVMVREVDRLDRVVSQLLEFSRPVIISGRSVNVEDLLKDAVTLIEKQAKDKNIAIETHFRDKVGEAFLDPDRFRQVILNLLLNAMDAIGDDAAAKGIIQVSLSRKNGACEIHITDNGRGISKENLSRIFDPYYTTKSSGTGLGLAICHNITEAHGGKIEVISEPGKGTEFRLCFPVKPLDKNGIKGCDKYTEDDA